MKHKYLLYIIIILSFFNFSFAQVSIEKKNTQEFLKNTIVKRINVPAKIWVKGYWKINNKGIRVWEKGYWKFEEKTFQQKSTILRKELNRKNQV